MKLTRRTLLGSAMAGAAIACNPDPGRTATRRTPDADVAWPGEGTPDQRRFVSGALCGDPSEEGLVACARYLGDAALTLVVMRWDGRAWTEHARQPVKPDSAGFAREVVSGLDPDDQVSLQFVDGDGRSSPVVRGRTAPSANHLGTVRVLLTSCSKWRDKGFPSLEHAVARGPIDLSIWAGDTIYAYNDTVEGFRETWRRYLDARSFRVAMPAAANVFTWDDHEITNNWAGDTVDPDQLAAGAQAYFEVLPIRTDKPGQLWRRLSYGPLVDVFVLDSRGHRDLKKGKYLGDQQRRWLIDGVRTSQAQWKLIVNSVPITRFPALFGALEEVLIDRWEGFPEAREAVLAGLDGIDGVLWLAGDFHLPALTRIEPEGPRSQIFEVMAGPLGSIPNPLGQLMWQQEEQNRAQFPWSASQYTATRIDFQAEEAYITFIGDHDEDWMTCRIDRYGGLDDLRAIEPPT